ncbi:hypothetical protein BH11BAC5_BH11BAC5_29800 [soil metagenome]
MKRNCRRLLVYALFSIMMSCVPRVLIAQPNPGDCDNQDPDLPPCPVDGGLSLLLAAGMVYGAKKVKDNRNKKTVPLI